MANFKSLLLLTLKSILRIIFSIGQIILIVSEDISKVSIRNANFRMDNVFTV